MMPDIDGRDTHLGSDIQRILGENIPFILRTQVWNGKLAHDLYTYMRKTLERCGASDEQEGLDIRAGLERSTALRCLIPGDPSAGPYPASLEDIANEVVEFLVELGSVAGSSQVDMLLDLVVISIVTEQSNRREAKA